MKEKITKLDDKILNLESKMLFHNPSSNEDIVHELSDRQSRSCNVILFNFPDSDEKNDEINIQDILRTMDVKIENISFTRMGKHAGLCADNFNNQTT